MGGLGSGAAAAQQAPNFGNALQFDVGELENLGKPPAPPPGGDIDWGIGGDGGGSSRADDGDPFAMMGGGGGGGGGAEEEEEDEFTVFDTWDENNKPTNATRGGKGGGKGGKGKASSGEGLTWDHGRSGSGTWSSFGGNPFASKSPSVGTYAPQPSSHPRR